IASYSSRVNKKDGEKTVYRSYSCPKRSSGICPNGISASVERYIHSVVTAALKGTQFRDALAKAQEKKRKEEAQKANSATAENLRSLRELKDVFMSQYSRASDTEVANVAFNRIAELNEEINRLVVASEDESDATLAAYTIDDIFRFMASADPAKLRIAYFAVLERIEVTSARGVKGNKGGIRGASLDLSRVKVKTRFS